MDYGTMAIGIAINELRKHGFTASEAFVILAKAVFARCRRRGDNYEDM